MKPNYTVPGVQCPIALINMTTKILSASMAEDLTQMVEIHGILPVNQFGCHPGRMTTDSLHYVIKFCQRCWEKR